jgi:hypothetical protein
MSDTWWKLARCGEPQQVGSPDEACAIVGIDVRLPLPC